MKKVAISFDVEEFDLPAEHCVRLPLVKQLEISTRGLIHVLDTLQGLGVRATFFCTANYAHNKPEIIRRIALQGHEIASHSYYHSDFKAEHLLQSRLALEQITGQNVKGYRAPRMANTSFEELKRAGYLWDSSLNPCYVPGRYNNFASPRKPFIDQSSGLIEIPTAVATPLRIPLFWLALHNFPMSLYKWLCVRCLKETGFLNIYFHPWEFADGLGNPELRVPSYIVRNSGRTLINRLAAVVVDLKSRKGVEFVTLSEVAAEVSDCFAKQPQV